VPADSPDAESWEGLPLELEHPSGGTPAGAGTPGGEETISRPISELAPAKKAVLTTPLLQRWLLLCASAAAALSLASIVLSLSAGGGPAPWQGGLLTLDCAVVIFVLRGYLVHGTPLRTVCHWVLSLSGLAAAAFVIQAAVLRSAARIIAWPPPPTEALTMLFASGLLGLAGIIVFVECLQMRSWACRSAAAAGVAFLALAVGHVLGLGAAPGRAAPALRGVPALCWPALAAVALGAGALAAGWQRRRERSGLALVLGGLALLAAGTAFSGYVLAGAGAAHGAAGGARRAWQAAAIWEAAALLPLALPGLAIAWRRPAPLRQDLQEARQFLWILVGLGVVAMVGVWLPTHLSVDLLHMGLVAAGAAALVTGAWMGARRGDWAGRWVLVPTGALAVLVLCTLGKLQVFAARLYPTGSELWAGAVTLCWCALAVGLVFATAGLAAKRQHGRQRLHEWLLWPDARLVCALGTGLCALALSAMFALWAGAPAVAEGVRAALTAGSALAGDLLALAGGADVRDAALRAADALGRALMGSPWAATAAGLLAVALGLHVAALSRARWALYGVAVLWMAPLAVASLLALLYAARLVLPWGAPEPATAAGSYLASSLGARIVLLGIGAALLVRLWESLGAALELAGRVAPIEAATAEAPPPPEQGLAFVVRAGLLLGCLGLGAALVLLQGRTLGGTLAEMGSMAGDWMHAAGVLTGGVGRLAAEWPGYAAAVAAVALVLIAVHDEALHGRVAVYPLLGLVWTLVVGVLWLAWALQVSATSLPASAGRIPALVAMGLMLLLLTAATATVWVRWWMLRRQASGPGEDLLDGADPIGAAHSLGSLGLVLAVGASVAVLLAALGSSPQTRPALARLSQAAASLRDWLALSVETARAHLRVRGRLGEVVALIGAASLAMLCLHLAGRRARGGVRLVLLVLWSGAALAGAAVGGYILLQVEPGQWSAARVLAAIALAAVVVRALVAAGSLGRAPTPAGSAKSTAST
jgi:hypothetical protein